MTTIGSAEATLTRQQVSEFIRDALEPLDLDGRSLCLVIPDATRRCPLPMLIDAVLAAVDGRVSSCTAVVALGTHAPMDPDAMRALIGTDAIPVLNHEWWKPETFVEVGRLERSSRFRPLGGSAGRGRRRTHQPGRRRQRCHADRRAGAAARGGGILRRQQVPVPRIVRARN